MRTSFFTFRCRTVGARASGCGFTLIELMVALAIVALLAAIAIPSFQLIRQKARQGRLVSDLRVFVGVIQRHVMETGEWPSASAPGVVPAEVVDAMPVAWSDASPMGGAWRWNSQEDMKSIVLVAPTASPEEFAKIDSRIDDGNASTGMLRVDGANWVYVLNEAP